MKKSYFQLLLKEHEYNLLKVTQDYFSVENKLAYTFKIMVEGNRFEDANRLLSQKYINTHKLFHDKPLTEIFLQAIDQHFTYTNIETYVDIWKKLLDMKALHFPSHTNLLHMVLKMQSPVKTDLIKELFSHEFEAKKLPRNPLYDFCLMLGDDVSEDTQNCMQYLIECGFNINEKIPQRRGLLNIEYTCLDLAVRQNNKNLATFLLSIDAESNFIGESASDKDRDSIAFNQKNDTYLYVQDYLASLGKILNIKNYLSDNKKAP